MELKNETFFEVVESQISTGQSVEIRMKGHSMRPLLRSERDRVILEPLGAAAPKRGDMVLFRHHGRHILHRIVAIESGNYTLSGDGNIGLWEHCRSEDIVARVSIVIRKSGREINVSSFCWRFGSAFWAAMPTLVRRYTLAILWRLGWR